MKRINILLLYLSALMISCSSSDTEDEDPLKGNINLITDWNNRGVGVEQPTNYFVVLGSQTLNYTQTSNFLPALDAGTYTMYIYNTAEKIIIKGTTVNVSSSNNNVDPNPGWLFTYISDLEYVDFKQATITAVMEQQVRELTITLQPKGVTKDKITSITANLSGVAGVWDVKTNTPAGTVMNVPLIFIKQADGTWQVSFRLLGVLGEEQKLIGKIAFENNSPVDMSLESDLSKDLTNFNMNKKTPVLLSGNMKETPTDLGFISSVTDWKKIDNTIIAE